MSRPRLRFLASNSGWFVARFVKALSSTWRVDVTGLEHLQRWLKQVGDRPAVTRGCAIPKPLDPSTVKEEELVAGARKMLS